MADLSPEDQTALDGFLKAQGAVAAPQPSSGQAHDDVWGSALTTGGKILDAFGQGAADRWGTDAERFNGLESELDKINKATGYSSSQTSLLKGYNEIFARPVAQMLDNIVNNIGTTLALPSRALTSLGGGLEYAAEPAQKIPSVGPAVSGALGAGGELSYFASETGIPELLTPSVPRAPVSMSEIQSARSLGVIGEGEAGYFETEPLTPRNAEARAAAAEEAGATPAEATQPAVQPPPRPTLPQLARQVDPDVFAEYDRLAAERQSHVEQLDALTAEREASPEVSSLRREIKSIVGVEEGEPTEEWNKAFWDSASDADRERLMAAELKLDDILHTETPEMEVVRQRAEEATRSMGGLLPQVSSAYRHAEALLEAGAEIAPERAGAEVLAQGNAHPGEEAAEAGVTPQAQEEPIAPEEGQARAVVPAMAEAAAEQAKPANVLAETSGAEKPLTARYGNLRAVQGTGEEVTRGLSEGVEAKAIEDSLTEGFGDLPEYRRISMADQAAKVAEFMKTDYETAKEVAMGLRQPPHGILPESVFVGVEKRALAEGDVETLRQLATRSRLSTAATTMGQRIRTLGERDKASPMTAIQQVQAAREAIYGSPQKLAADKVAEVQNMRSELRKAAPRIDAFAQFMKSIECEI